MTCKLQHYISQHHQRGFTEGPRKKATVWVYRADGRVFRTGTAGYGASNYFYSDPPDRPEEVTVDAEVTEFEAIVHPWLSQLRDTELDTPVDSTLAGTLVTHLSVRTAFLRESIESATAQMLDVMRDMTGTGQLATMLGLGSEHGAQAFMELADEEIEKLIAGPDMHGMPKLVQDMVRSVARSEAQKVARGALNAQINQEGRHWTRVFDQIKSNVKPTMRERIGHVMANQPAPAKHVERLASLHWVLEAAQNGLGTILPDCVAVAREINGRVTGYFGADYSQMVAVALPVASDRILVGRTMDTSGFTNAEMAAASHSAFIADRCSDELKELVPTIGSSPAIDLGNEQSGLLADLRSGRLRGASR